MSNKKGNGTVRKMAEYAEGKAANGANQNADTCPKDYEGARRSAWMAGWYEAEAKRQSDKRARDEAAA